MESRRIGVLKLRHGLSRPIGDAVIPEPRIPFSLAVYRSGWDTGRLCRSRKEK